MGSGETPDIDDAEDPRPAHGRPFGPPGFQPPVAPLRPDVWLEPLGPQHDDADYEAWTSSMEHIHATPGFEQKIWPHPMTPDQNLADLERHARHFEQRLGFTYTVLDAPGGEVIGCVYIYPSTDPAVDADIRSWVRESHASLDADVATIIATWLRDEWPFATVTYR